MDTCYTYSVIRRDEPPNDKQFREIQWGVSWTEDGARELAAQSICDDITNTQCTRPDAYMYPDYIMQRLSDEKIRLRRENETATRYLEDELLKRNAAVGQSWSEDAFGVREQYSINVRATALPPPPNGKNEVSAGEESQDDNEEIELSVIAEKNNRKPLTIRESGSKRTRDKANDTAKDGDKDTAKTPKVTTSLTRIARMRLTCALLQKVTAKKASKATTSLTHCTHVKNELTACTMRMGTLHLR